MREALKLLLNEMEYVLRCIDEDIVPFDDDDFHEALRLGKEALAQPKPDLTEQQRESYQKGHNDGVAHHKQAVKAAQPEQEPVMGTKTWFEDGKVVTQHLTAKDIYKEPEQEPVAWMCRAFDGKVCEQSNHDECENPIPLYTSPPKREWADLTDKQKKHAEATCMKHGLDAAIYYVQITLKEKNA